MKPAKTDKINRLCGVVIKPLVSNLLVSEIDQIMCNLQISTQCMESKLSFHKNLFLQKTYSSNDH